MRFLILLSTLILAGAQTPALAQTDDPRPEVAVVTVSLDQARQGQIKHGRDLIAALVDDRSAPFRLVEPTMPADDFRSCEEDTPEFGLDHCARFYLSRARGAAAHVAVVFADRPGDATGRRGGDMRALCFGQGAGPADPAAQDIWLWTGSARMHGVRDWARDRQALAACISAAASETGTGPGRPDAR